MKYQLRAVLASVISGSLLLLGGCFPSDDNKDSSNPTTPTNLADSIPTHNDDPTVMPVNINQAANTTEAGIDSMFTLLINRTKKLDSISSPSELYTIDFTSLRGGFGAAVTKSPNHVKANIGFIVSSVLSINSSKDLQKIVDSMDRYINDLDTYNSSDNFLIKKPSLQKSKSITCGLLSRTFAKHGILSAGQALIAETPKVLLAQTSQMPSFPKFITVSYIQDAIEANVLPRLNEVLGATQRLKAISGMTQPVTIDNETYEIDASDILILEASLRAARAGFSMMLVYDMDIYNPDGTTSPKWIDSIQSIYNSDDELSSSEIKYSICGDTLLVTYYYDFTLNSSYIYDLYSYNFSRSGFLSVKKNYFSAVYDDLKEIPVLLKAGIASINSESDLQDDDILPAVKISDLTEEMSSFSTDLLEEGLTPSFASKFQSPSNLMDFISLILTQPYTFDEKIDDKHVKITVDISKFFTNPAPSLKDYWPKYRIPAGNDRFDTYTLTVDASSYNSNKFTIFDDYSYNKITVDIPSSLIDSIAKDTSLSYVYSDYYLKNIIKYRTYKDSIRNFVPILYVDDNNKSIDFYQYLRNDTLTLQDLNNIFPYFNDYTLRGIFPDMKTRQNWIDFFGVFTN